MRNVARLVEFSAMAAECPDAAFYTTNSDPTHVGTVTPDKIPPDWSIIDFDDGVPDTEQTLGLSKGTRLILFSAETDTAAFYYVRGKKDVEATNTAFKQMRDVADTWKAMYDKKCLEVDERDALIASQAQEIERLRRKLDKKKRQLKDMNDADALTFIDQVVSSGVETTARMFGIQIPDDEGAEDAA